MKSTRTTLLVLLIGASIVATACRTVTSDRAVPACFHKPNVVAWDKAILMNTVGFTGPAFKSTGIRKRHAKLVAVRDTSSRRTETGTLEAWAQFQNCTGEPVQVDARAHFFGHMQEPVEEPSEWRRLFLAANSVGTFKELSRSGDEVAYYYIEVREAR